MSRRRSTIRVRRVWVGGEEYLLSRKAEIEMDPDGYRVHRRLWLIEHGSGMEVECPCLEDMIDSLRAWKASSQARCFSGLM